MMCTLCGRDLASAHEGNIIAFVSVSINGKTEQAYCGSPRAADSKGLSCWQDAIEAWHRLIVFDQTMPSRTTIPTSRPLPVRSTVRSRVERQPALGLS